MFVNNGIITPKANRTKHANKKISTVENIIDPNNSIIVAKTKTIPW